MTETAMLERRDWRGRSEKGLGTSPIHLMELDSKTISLALAQVIRSLLTPPPSLPLTLFLLTRGRLISYFLVLNKYSGLELGTKGNMSSVRLIYGSKGAFTPSKVRQSQSKYLQDEV
jgi:hypothetical protein